MSCCAHGLAISKPVSTCELIEPSTCVVPPASGPHTCMGINPLFDCTCTPKSRSGASIMLIGRVLREPCPWSVRGEEWSAAIGVNMRIPKPDSPQLSLFVRGLYAPLI